MSALPCSIGKANAASACSGELQDRSCLASDASELLRRRSGTARIDCVCHGHFEEFMRFFPLRQKKCCSPMESFHKKAIRSGLVEISLELAREAATFNILLVPGKKLCNNCLLKCKLKIQDLKQNTPSTSSLSSKEQESDGTGAGIKSLPPTLSDLTGADDDELFHTPPDVALSDVNKCFLMLGLEPVDHKKLVSEKYYPQNKVEEIKNRVIHKMQRAAETDFSEIWTSDWDETLSQLKIRFGTADKNTKIQILSVLPKSWSIKKVAHEFGTSEFMVRSMKQLVVDQGILPTLNPHLRVKIHQDVIDKVVEFYHENSRMLPGSKDVKSVVIDGKRIKKQKELLLVNMSELHLLFKEENPTLDISLTKFANLRPQECVLAGASGTHSVCVCLYHENFGLMVEAARLEKEGQGKKTMSIRDVFGIVVCSMEELKPDCFFRSCAKCPDFDVLRDLLQETFDLRMQATIEFKKWITVDRCQLETCVTNVEDFIDYFLEELPAVLKHHFIAVSQGKFLKTLKENLKEGECIVTGDFSENYAPIMQRAIQGVHWDKTTVTLQPFVCYYKENSELKLLKLVIVSDTHDHKNIVVYVFQQKLLPYLQVRISNLRRIYYFSDGAASQYKNRSNVLNLRMHFEDFGVHAEWHFFASCHGKGPCDGIGGTVKREAARVSLQGATIITALQLFSWAKTKFHESIDFVFVSQSDIAAEKEKLKDRFQNVEAVDGIFSAHSIIPKSRKVIVMKEFSAAETCIYIYYGKPEEAGFEDFHGFIIVQHENSWKVAFVYNRYESERSVEVILLDAITPFRYKFNTERNAILKTAAEVITVVNMKAESSNDFRLNRKDFMFAQKAVQTSSQDQPITKRKKSQTSKC